MITTPQINEVIFNSTALGPIRTSVGVGAAGANVLVAGVAGFKIRVIAIAIFSAGSVNAYIEDEGGKDLVGDASHTLAWSTAGQGGLKLEANLHGWFDDTDLGEGIVLQLSAEVVIAGCISYILIPDAA